MAVRAYRAPRSIPEAVSLLASEPGAFALSGGTDLLVQQRSGARDPGAFIDLKRIPGMLGIEEQAACWRIGASTPCVEIAAHAGLRREFPGLVEAAGLIGSKQVQGRASLGGNLCNASPAADSVPALVVNRASLLISGRQGERRIAAECLTLGPGRTVLGSGEFLSAVEIPRAAVRQADAYLRFIPRTEMDIAVVGAAAALQLDAEGRCTAARIALGAVAPTVLTVPEADAVLIGTRLDTDAVAACVAIAQSACKPISDRRGTAEFRRHVAGVLLRRVIAIAAQRAAQGA
jgi:carbon-monoxide dehydrogenase medium subunit